MNTIPSTRIGRPKPPGDGEARIVKIRWVKAYEGAQNHVCIGQVVEETPNVLKVRGRTWHFRRPQGGAKTVVSSQAKLRWIPWERIEVVTELPEDTDWEHLRFEVDPQGRLCAVGSTVHGELVSD